MQKQTIKKQFKKILSIALILVFICGVFYKAHAIDYNKKIREAKERVRQYSQQSQLLRKRASTLQEEIRMLSYEKEIIQKDLNKTIQEIKETEKQIKITEENIAKNEDVLGDLLVKIYVSENMSTLERVASSKNIADFMDEESKLKTVKHNVGVKIKQIKEQRQKLKYKKIEKDSLLAKQEAQKQEIVAKEQDKNSLLAETRNNEAIYQSLIVKGNQEIKNLEEAQAEYNRKKVLAYLDGNSYANTYPAKWDAPHGKDTLIDDWRMLNRECVSYTAWKVHESYLAGKTKRDMPIWGGIGNAWQWAFSGWKNSQGHWRATEYSCPSHRNNRCFKHTANAIAYGIHYGTTPKVGSVAIRNGGYGRSFGHAMWVEKVNGDGTIIVSQYNIGRDGKFHVTKVSASGLRFLYFD